jgi:hypothetical protein
MTRSESLPSTALVIDLFPKSSGDDLHPAAAVLRASLGRLCAARELLEQTRVRLGGQLGEQLQAELHHLETSCIQLAAELYAFSNLRAISNRENSQVAGQSV